MQKKLLIILGLLIFADIAYFGYSNIHTNITVSYKPFLQNFDIRIGLLILATGIYGAIGAALIMFSKSLNLKEQIKKLTRSNEKTSIDSEENQDKVKLLEAKIQTLEIALKNALKK